METFYCTKGSSEENSSLNNSNVLDKMFLLRNVETKNGYFGIAVNTPFLEPTFFKGIGLL